LLAKTIRCTVSRRTRIAAERGVLLLELLITAAMLLVNVVGVIVGLAVARPGGR